MSTAHVKGMFELERKLAALADAVTAKRLLDATAKAAMQPMLAAAKSNARRTPTDVTKDLGPPHLQDQLMLGVSKVRPGTASSVALKIRKGGRTVEERARVKKYALANKAARQMGLSKKHRRQIGLFLKNPRRTWHLVEWGSYNKRTKRRNKAYPFIRPAFDTTVERCITLYREEARKRIERLAKRKG